MHQGHRDRPVISCGVLRGHGLAAGSDGRRGIVSRGIFRDRRLPTDRTLLGSRRPNVLFGDDGVACRSARASAKLVTPSVCSAKETDLVTVACDAAVCRAAPLGLAPLGGEDAKTIMPAAITSGGIRSTQALTQIQIY
jgi:hypothetical protein